MFVNSLHSGAQITSNCATSCEVFPCQLAAPVRGAAWRLVPREISGPSCPGRWRGKDLGCDWFSPPSPLLAFCSIRFCRLSLIERTLCFFSRAGEKMERRRCQERKKEHWREGNMSQL